MAKYGKTFWGKEWLNALNNIDFGNRLPRGSSYASKGAITSVIINHHNIDAKVQGSRPRPYKVLISVPEFTPKQQETLTDLLAGNPAWLASLLNRQLPPELLSLSRQQGIYIFPKQWSDLEMSCSCPDFAVPCKHLAAVVYILANEIDLNPMLELQLHGYDAVAALQSRQINITESLTEPVEDLFAHLQYYQPRPLVINEEIFTQLDLAPIPFIGDSFLNLLPAATPFHASDFKSLLLAHLKYVRKAEINLTQVWRKKANFGLNTCIEGFVLIDSNWQQARLRLIYEHHTKEIGLIEWLSETLKDLKEDANLVTDWPPTLQLLHAYLRLALKLLVQSAILPKLFRANNTHLVQWEPLLQNEAVNNALQPFIFLSPAELLQVETNKNKYSIFPQAETAVRLTSVFIGEILKEVTWQSSRFDQNDYFQQLFFGETLPLPRTLKPDQVFPALQLWLRMLHLSQRDWVPVIQVEEDFPEFRLSVAVRQHESQTLQAPVPLHRFKTEEKYQQQKLPVIKDLMLLQEHFPDIARVVNTEHELHLRYDPENFADVLLKILPLLGLLGMEILLPKSLRHLVKPQAALRLSSSAKDKVRSWLDLQNLLDFDWQVALGEEALEAKEFLKLVKDASGIVKLRDRFIHLTPEDLEKLMKQLQKPPTLSKQEAMRVLFAEEYQGVPIQVTDELRKILKELTSVKAIAPPATLQATRRPYQQRGYEWLYKNSRVGFGSILADDMGLGKTLQTITLLLKLKDDDQLTKAKALIVAPTTLLTNWSRELEKFAPNLTYSIYHGPNRNLKNMDGQDVLLTSYGTIRSDVEKLNGYKWQVLIIDEAQNIKNPDTAQTKAIKSLKANLKIALSGTPVENRLSEYWSIFDFTNKGFLGTAHFFQEYFARPISLDHDHQKLAAFRKLTEPFVLRRLKTDKTIISDLPDKIENTLYCSLAKEQAAVYENVVDQAMQQVEDSEGIERKGLVLKMMTALKQICNHPYQYLKEGKRDPTHSGKLQLLLDILRPIQENGEKTLIFTQYKKMGELLVAFLEQEFGAAPLFLHGSQTRQQRDELVNAFQNFRHHRIFILSLKAGGTGLNLTAAQNVVHYDLWWNPAVEAQATDRAYRIGQKQNVMLYRLLSKGTLEEKIDDMIRAKKELADLTVGTGEKWLGELNNKELRDLVKLSARVEGEAV
ncbi:DEAD/DEAH box helicase [Adhaeribacter rhizoryzae]|uniref:DEAD/DEAH box helicase n=2 Tax=Adhaeribacter rhizoryzae TaxID=2607907 RepID=A0A5M6DT20_9BACT|nr:DEAD/DEAH box helicase [Adhaeribacter rhizoryzae]